MKAEGKAKLNRLLESISDRRDVTETWPLLVSKDEGIFEVETAVSQRDVPLLS